MSQPDDVARLREIKRLLDRIQRLPRIAGIPANGSANGSHAGPANGLRDGFRAGPPHPTLDEEPEPELKPVSPPPLDPTPPPLELPDRSGERRDFWEGERKNESRALVPARQSVGIGISPWVFIMATAVNTIVAAVLAVVITLGVARRESPPGEIERAATVAKPAPQPQAEPALPRPVELLPVGSPTAPFRLEALKPARLPFQVRPEEAAQDSYILLLSGLPANALLSGAARMGADSWLLSPGVLQRLDIVVPEWSASVIEVGVELRHTNGAVAAQSKLWLAVPPPPTPAGASLDEATITELVRSGDRLLSRGDVAAARAIYERAAAMGSAQAALAMGSTYDPRRLWSLGVFGMVGNKERARHWYQRAGQLGHPDAKARINALR
jgi:hypothetical protein